MQSYIFIKYFLISTILYEGSTLINFGFLMKKEFWYVVSISDFKASTSALLSFVYKIFTVSKKSCKVDASQVYKKNLKPYEIRISYFGLNLKTKLPRFYLQL